MITPYQAKYYAHELTKRFPSDSNEKLAGALVDAQVDLNPHQIEAALFAFRSPLSKGALLADEVGLGKTIEAGLVLSQRWAERKRRILIITPSNLRKQWHQELQEKFFLPCRILEAKAYNNAIKIGNFQPFEIKDSIVICSYQFARSKAVDVHRIPWDLVVIDEAHRLRNVYKTSNVIANTLKNALQNAPKLLLTATPLQNSLLELFGLVSFVDEQTFGDLKSFREQFMHLNEDQVFNTLKARLKPVCHRTLRRQVQSVPYTNRLPMVERFTPEEGEDKLYHLVSEYLRRENLQALPNSQRSLMTLVLRKLLASSTFAIAGALETLIARLKIKLAKQTPSLSLEEELDEDYESLDETAEEWEENGEVEFLSETDQKALAREIADLETFRDLAVSITYNAKGKALITALEKAFSTPSLPRKAIVFTESRKTQDYLMRLLTETPYKDGIVLFNGSNNDPKSKEIYKEWLNRHEGTDKVTGSKTADMRSALVDYFRDKGQIMIATEAGSEGINLQFCALVVNYDLPWNPQRIEQRIGRCHRYGQKHDVVVVNFINLKNEADQRVFQLLSEKFHLFEGVFGASDEVLGAIESGVDFERRIAEIYQRCREPEEIKARFDQLQQELNAQISDSMTHTRRQLLENFDAEVLEKLKVNKETSEAALSRYERMLMDVTHFGLQEHAAFTDDRRDSFRLNSLPFEAANDEIPLGLYELPRRSGEAHLYRLGHPLAQKLLEKIKSESSEAADVIFDASGARPKVSALEPYIGKSGQLSLSILTIEALDQVEDYLLFSAHTDDGQSLDHDLAKRLSMLPIQSLQSGITLDDSTLKNLANEQKAEIQLKISERNAQFFEQEADKLDGWAEDLKVTLEREIKEMDRTIKEAKRAATLALTLEEKLAGQKQVKTLESQRNEKRRRLFDAQDEIDRRRGELIAEIEGKLKQEVFLSEIFKISWTLE
ncbi:SNF2-related protein [Nitrosomonas ureae]|uniref:Adenine-specific DNA-methyltransferase n=1 Tax=Nitrosomonas ureae TaxID=44577 RepID=A0A1H5YBE3_9PROT|nr:SNF2-related protein [Nitrosomonas ureae]SEG21419.1 adenine-specific DNA-methyltransferase [Nitrosomonas ureae]